MPELICEDDSAQAVEVAGYGVGSLALSAMLSESVPLSSRSCASSLSRR